MVQHRDSVPSLNCTAISIDSPHMHRDGAGKSILPLAQGIDNTRRSRHIAVIIFGSALWWMKTTVFLLVSIAIGSVL